MNSQKGLPPRKPQTSGQERTERASPDISVDADSQSDAHSSGRATFDSRGNAVWEWKTEEPGKFSRDVNTQYIKQLEASDLSLEDGSNAGTNVRPQSTGHEGNKGFNPYARAGAATEKAATQPNADDTSRARKPIKDLRRYNEWLKLKQRMAEKKDDE